MRYRSLDPNRFPNYREITAGRAGVATCGHPIKVGDRIGWNKRAGGKTQCATCWRKWVAENQEADYLEANPGACCW